MTATYCHFSYLSILKILFVSLTGACAVAASAAGSIVYRVSAIVTDSIGQPELYATVRIFEATDSVKPVVLTTTDDNGALDAQLPDAGSYRLHISSVGKIAAELSFSVSDDAPEANLGSVLLADNVNELGQVEVVAQRPLVAHEIDRLGYDVKADPDAATSTLRDILRRVPLVSVDNEGNIKVKGSSDFRIYKNGRPNNSYTRNAKEIFAAIPASSIKKIEVITDPGAREDAEGVGVILNIVTDTDTAMKGVTGTVNLYEDTENLIPTPSVWLSSQIDKVTFSVNGGYQNIAVSNHTKSWSDIRTEYYDSGNLYEASTYSEYPQQSGWGGLELSWEPDTLNLFSVEANGWLWGAGNQTILDWVRMYGPGEAGSHPLLYSYSSIMRPGSNRDFDFDGSVNYQHSTRRKGETLTLSYRISTTAQDNDSETLYSDMIDCSFGYTGKYMSSVQNFIEHTAQADWSRPIGERHKFDVGAKGIFRRNHSVSDQEYYGSDMHSHDNFTHLTTVAAAYADWRTTLGKWSLRAGLRYEYSHLSAHFREQTVPRSDFASDLSDWVPNASVAWNVNEANSLKLSYSRNIRRPGISFLDPAVSVTPTSVSYGNPDLGSVAYNNFSFNYSLIRNNFNLDLNLSGTVVDNSLQNSQWVDEQGRLVNTYANIGRMRAFDSSIYFQWTIDSKTRWIMNLWWGYTYLRQPIALDADGNQVFGSRGRWAVNPWTRISRDLPWKLELSLTCWWWSGGLSNVYTYQNSSKPGYAMALVRKFLKDDRLTVRLAADRPFGPKINGNSTVTNNPQYSSETHYTYHSGQYFSLSLNFRFGSLSAQVKKTSTSISNSDLQGQGQKK
ncbi:MAG: TonB-dependent receptor [Bacteroidales bacterium]|nr:TonB-dependent receptor [Bacteroidales bacterium]